MNIPKPVQFILSEFKKRGFQAYVVGGCVRDLIMDREPKDWDVATDVLPKEIQKIFPDSFYKNKFGTVTVRVEEMEVEVTTFRVDEKYTDKRHPDKVRFSKNLQEDLARRDFTMNALAIKLTHPHLNPPPPLGRGRKGGGGNLPSLEIIDPFDGQGDIKKKLIRAVGEAKKRFDEDALRLMRAARFAIELSACGGPAGGWGIESKTKKAIQQEASGLRAIAKERIRDELIKILMTPRADEGILLLQELKLLQFIIPELEKGVEVTQNRHHIYTVFEHLVMSLKFASQRNYNLEVRLAALFHDIAKPQVKQGEGPDSTFYAHDVLSAKFAIRILDRLRFPKKIIDKVVKLIRAHMFVYDVGAVSEAAVRRLLRRVGPENIQDLINLRVADRLGSGCPKAVPYKLRHLQYLIEKVSHDAISAKMLKIDGNEIMKILKIKPGPKVGAILDVLLAEVLEEPKKNTKKYLNAHIKELNKEDLEKLRKMAKAKVEERKEEEDLKIKGKYWVK